MHSSSADWVFGEARLISSATTMFAKIGPGRNSNCERLPVVDADPGDVAGHQVGGELHPADGRVHRPGQRLRQHGLAGAGDVLDQQVTLGEHRDDRQPDHLGFAQHHLRDRRGDLPADLLTVSRLTGPPALSRVRPRPDPASVQVDALCHRCSSRRAH